MNLPKSISTVQIMGFRHLSDKVGWIKVQMNQTLFIRVILPKNIVIQIQDEWLSYLADGLDRDISIAG